jgi:hypothetical protein
MVYVEELGDAGERGLAFFVVGVAPGLEDNVLTMWPGDDGACFVFAEDCYGGVEGVVGGVRGDRRRPDKLGPRVSRDVYSRIRGGNVPRLGQLGS